VDQVTRFDGMAQKFFGRNSVKEIYFDIKNYGYVSSISQKTTLTKKIAEIFLHLAVTSALFSVSGDRLIRSGAASLRVKLRNYKNLEQTIS